MNTTCFAINLCCHRHFIFLGGLGYYHPHRCFVPSHTSPASLTSVGWTTKPKATQGPPSPPSLPILRNHLPMLL
ncbi:hypothetical protein BDZ94DRAFT_1251342 [Collybia nuda]|uniref:Uncharacterized protein n=1 Tax=Collybia nuda TaxID=64659 RepID=A0A9P5YAY8_9AGAR|nr:hypothetical protein BDZ94DRAFT_1251342 [Collybia nuda]